MYNKSSEKSNELNFGKIIRLLFMQSKLLIAFALIGLSFGLANYFTTEKEYELSSLMQVVSNKSNNFGSDVDIDFLLGSTSTSDLNNIEDLYTSRTNILNIILNNNLNLNFIDDSNNASKRVLSFRTDTHPDEDELEVRIKSKKDSYLLYLNK